MIVGEAPVILGLAGLGLIVIVAVGIGIGAISNRSARRVEAVPALDAFLVAARRQATVAVAFAALVLLTLFVLGLAAPALLGLPFVMAGGLSGSAGLCLYAATPPRADPVRPNAPRSASLTPRGPTTFISRPLKMIVAVLVVLQVGFVVLAGVTSSPDERGLYRSISFATAHQASSASPYAGWYYSIPWSLSTVALVVSLVFALRRVSTTAALSASDLHGVDTAWRRATSRILATSGAVALALPLGGAIFVSGSAMHRASFGEVFRVWADIGAVMQIGGAVLLMVSAVTLVLVGIWAVNLPRRVARDVPGLLGPQVDVTVVR